MSGFVHQGESPLSKSNLDINHSQLAPGDDLIMSNMYSLLNFIAATSKDTHDGTFQGIGSHDYSTLNSLENGLRGLSEDEKRLTGISTISVVTRLALEFQIEEV